MNGKQTALIELKSQLSLFLPANSARELLEGINAAGDESAAEQGAVRVTLWKEKTKPFEIQPTGRLI